MADQNSSGSRRVLRWLLPLLVFCGSFALYAATAAPGTLFGDPSEYQFVPAILGIAHPPGYAFYTLLAKLWQTVVAVGTVAYRTNLLAAAVGAWTVTVVYLTVRDLGERVVEDDQSKASRGMGHAPGPQEPLGLVSVRPFGTTRPEDTRPLPEHQRGRATESRALLDQRLIMWAALAAAASLAVAADFWQHSIHSNAHIVSAALAGTHIWLLVRWWRTGRDRWLGGFALTLGLAATHHPITLMGAPAYGVFVLVVRPRILRQGRLLVGLVGCLLLGLSPLLYYPLRSPSAPFGPTDMRTWAGFWQHATAQGLRVNLFHFGLADQPDRWLVFWSILRQQFSLVTILFILLGGVFLVRRLPKVALFMGVFIAGHLLFTLNTVQDVMAYLLLPLVSLGVVGGMGMLAAGEVGGWRLEVGSWKLGGAKSNVHRAMCNVLFLALVLPWPLFQACANLSRGIALTDFAAAEEWAISVRERFAGRGEGAVLLSGWEYLTPLWVHEHTQDEGLAREDVQLVYVSTATPWVDAVWSNIERGPIYLPDYRPVVRDAGFRLIPEGGLYRVLAPPVSDTERSHRLGVWADERVHILGYDLNSAEVRAGEPLILTLYQSVAEPLEDIWMPYARLGPVEARWTTDSRLLTPQWLPGEVVVERYELPVPFDLAPGEYPLQLGYADLSRGRPELALSSGDTIETLTTIAVVPNDDGPTSRTLEQLLANLDNQIGLEKARVRIGLQTRRDTWQEPLLVRPGKPLHLTLTWRALASPRDSYTIFVHLIDGAGRPVFGHDYTPLGGASPTYLWFPKWLPGQRFIDPYRLMVPADLPPGEYWLELGMYGMTSLRRLPVVDLAGDLAGDRVILGPLRVEGP
jgi:hypothetical protein